MQLRIPKAAIHQLCEDAPCGQWVVDEDMQVLYANRMGRQMLSDVGQALRGEQRELLRGGAVRLEAGKRLLELSMQPLSVGEGRIYLLYAFDATAMREMTDRYNMMEQFLNASENQGIIACDQEGKIIFYNAHAEKMEGVPARDMLGKYHDEVYHHYTSSNITKVLRTGKPLIDVEAHYRSQSGRTVHSFGCVYPIHRDGRLVGVFAVSRYSDSVRQLLLHTIELQKQLFEEKKASYNGTKFSFDDICGNGEAISQAVENAKRAALSPSTVLLYGETGTGKEMFAQSIHNCSVHKDEPFVPVNCAAIPESITESILFGTVKGAYTGAEQREGLFEQAGKGTIFLDEINSMSLDIQSKLLRVLQERTVRRVGGKKEIPVRCRIISSTNADPLACMERGALREDLYYRLAIITVRIPSLRERGDDIIQPAESFCRKYAAICGKSRIEIDEECRTALCLYRWPGNVRELQHVVEQAIVMLDGDTLTMRNLPQHLRRAADDPLPAAPESPVRLHDALQHAEYSAIKNALERNEWNISRTSRELDIARSNLQYRMKKLGIIPPGRTGTKAGA